MKGSTTSSGRSYEAYAVGLFDILLFRLPTTAPPSALIFILSLAPSLSLSDDTQLREIRLGEKKQGNNRHHVYPLPADEAALWSRGDEIYVRSQTATPWYVYRRAHLS